MNCKKQVLKLENKYLNELKLAEEFLISAKNNLPQNLRTSANRLYFSFEKLIIAYLLFKDVKVPKNHQKIWELASELLGDEYYQFLRILYDLRMQADYGNKSIFVDLNINNLEYNFLKVESYFIKIKNIINSSQKKKF